MLEASLREITKHAQQVRRAMGSLIGEGSQLAAYAFPDRLSTIINVRVGDRYDSLAAGRSSFATKLPGVVGEYFEIWLPATLDKYKLSKGYLHLTASTSASDQPIDLLFVHTEPQSPPKEADDRQVRMFRWRSGPHLHVKASRFGLGRCHIHLDSRTVPCSALQSLPRYRESLQIMVGMLADELTEYFDLSQSS